MLLLHGDAGAARRPGRLGRRAQRARHRRLHARQLHGARRRRHRRQPGDDARVDRLAARVVDAERALALLASASAHRPGADRGDGLLVGRPHRAAGGADPLRLGASARAGVGFAAYIALYPDCNVRLLDDTKAEPGPLRIFIGEADVLTDAGACTRYVAAPEEGRRRRRHHHLSRCAPRLRRRQRPRARFAIPGVPIAARCNLDEIARARSSTSTPAASSTMATPASPRAWSPATTPAADAAAKAAVKALLSERFALRALARGAAARPGARSGLRGASRP